jgi:transcriptional regulator with XRE-family HTH domain
MRTEAFANPRVLEWVRRMAGLETQDAARKAGVKPERHEGWESGERRLTITELCKLADIYMCPLGARRCGNGAS